MNSAKILQLAFMLVKWVLVCSGALFLASTVSIVFFMHLRGQDFDLWNVMESAAESALRGGGIMALFLGAVFAVNYFKSGRG